MKGQPSSPSEFQEKILKNLAKYEVLTARDLALLIYGNDKHSSITTINKALEILDERDHLVNRIYFRPEEYLGRGNLPNASGLSDKGVEFADRWPATYPKEFPRTHSPHTIEHDLRRARTHIRIQTMADNLLWDVGWKKGGYALVKPDDTFELTHYKTSHFFLEEEHKRKDFDALYEKLKPYVELHGSGQMKEQWGFRYYTVIIPMRDQDAMDNVLAHFKGACNCIDPKLKQKHKGAPFKLTTDVLAFTTHDAMMTMTNDSVLHTPSGKKLSFLDIVH